MHILIAEDEIYSAIAFEQLLLEHGYSVHVAYDGDQALELLDRFSFDLALLDAEMPNVSGYEVAKAVREKEGRTSAKPLTLVHFSGHLLSPEELKSKGFNAQLQKPVLDANQLFALIQALTAPSDLRARV